MGEQNTKNEEMDSAQAAEIAKLVEKARRGNSAAFGELYEKYFDPIYRYIFFQVRSKNDAEDLVQNVFLKAFRAVEKFVDQGVPFSAWLYTIARNSVIDHWKKKRDVLLDEPSKVFDMVPDDNVDIEASAEEKERAEFLHKCLNELSEDHREIIILQTIEDLPYAKISKITGKNEEALRALKHRAIQSLKKVIDKNIKKQDE